MEPDNMVTVEEEPLLAEMKERRGGLSIEGKKLPQYLGALAACLSALCAGTSMGWTTGAAKIKAGQQDLIISEDEWSWIGSCLAIGAIISALPIGSLVDVVGRRCLMLILAPIMLAGWLFIVFASEVWMLLVGRLLLGGVTGGFCIITPMYTGEIAESSIRGILGSYFQLLITVGILLVYVLGAVIENVRWVSIICAILPVVFGVVFYFFPDSPRWYLSKGKNREAKSALIFYRGREYDVDNEILEINEALDEAKRNRVSCVAAFSSRAAKMGLVLSLGTMFFQQFSGVNAVIFYATDIFESAKTSLKPEESSVIVGVCQVVATYISTLLIDRLGRRSLLLISGSVMAVCNIVLGVYYYLKMVEKQELEGLGWLPILSVSIFIALFSIGYGPIPWLYMGEIFAPQVKGVAMSIANMSNWTCAFIITMFFNMLAKAIGEYSVFWGFAGILILGCVFVSTLLLETKGKSLEQIQADLGGRRR